MQNCQSEKAKRKALAFQGNDSGFLTKLELAISQENSRKKNG